MAFARLFACVVALGNKLFVFGGIDNTHDAVDCAEVIDLSTVSVCLSTGCEYLLSQQLSNQLQGALASFPMPMPLVAAAATVHNGLIFLAGGYGLTANDDAARSASALYVI